MNDRLKNIQALVGNEMKDFEPKFRESMQSHVVLLDKIMHYIVKRKGKQMRPMFVFLTSKMCGGVTEATYRGAALIELLHTATLVHDDVVDDANYRRGFFSVNALWKNKIAVLVGDYLLSRGLLLSINNGDFELLKIVSHAVKEMSEGELLQIEKARKLDITEEVYFEIIRQKTASLIASCCGVGAASAGVEANMVEKARLVGEKIGLAFQMKDDLFDYGTNEIGKPVGIDIKEKKMTLPLIYTINNSSEKTKKHIINLVKNKSHKPEKVVEVIELVKNTDGIAYTTKKMNQLLEEAVKMIDEFPESEYREGLKDLMFYTIEREK